MRAIVRTQYGRADVLRLQDVERPPSPGEGEVLIEVRAVALNAFDRRMLAADPFLVRLEEGLFRPKTGILGADVAGRVVQAGPGTSRIRPGDEIFGDLSGSGCGGLAEYVCAPEELLVPKPANLTFEQAAAVPMAALTALQGLRDAGRVRPGQSVLINGASGGVGTFCVQFARVFEADITAVCSTANVETARSLGAGQVIDYRQTDFAALGRKYDLVLGVNGYRPIADYKNALKDTGIYLMVGGTNRQIFEALLLGPWHSRSSKKLGPLTIKPNRDDLLVIKRHLEEGTVVPVIDRVYPLEQAAEAFAYMEEGHARGKVVISVSGHA